MIKITGKIGIFVEWKENPKDKNKPIFKASARVEEYFYDEVTHQRDKDHPIYRDSYEVTFSTKNFPYDTHLSKLKPDTHYVFEVYDGWITTRTYVRKDGTKGHAKGIFINEAKCVNATKVDVAKREEARKAFAERNEPEQPENPDLPF